MNGDVKNYDVVVLTYKPNDIFVDSINMLMGQVIAPNMIYICNTCEDDFCKNISNKVLLDETLSGGKNGQFKDRIKLVHIAKNEFDHGKTRNEMLKLSNSNYVLFLTDDALPYDEHLSENLISGFGEYSLPDARVAVTYARQIARETASLKEKLIREYNYPSHDVIKEKSKEKVLGIKNYFCSNVCAMYDREIFNSLGGFEENIILNEDTFYSYHAIQNGYRIVYKANAKVYHSHNYTYKEQFNRNFDIGVSQNEQCEIFNRVPSEKEGLKLIKYVVSRLVKGMHFILVIDFLIECLYRYFGYNFGKKFDKLDKDTCVKYASNKQYFIRKGDYE